MMLPWIEKNIEMNPKFKKAQNIFHLDQVCLHRLPTQAISGLAASQ